jgi:endoglucanase
MLRRKSFRRDPPGSDGGAASDHRHMRGRILALVVVLAGLVAAVPSPVTAATTTRPTAGVRVRGATLVDMTGRPVRLLGVNHSGGEYACAQGWGVFEGDTSAAGIAAMRSWHVNAVRLPLNALCWLGDTRIPARFRGAAYRDAVAAYVGRLNAAGLVVVLDLHWSAANGDGGAGQRTMADADHAPRFWRSVASRFRARRGVIFDLYNEPHDIPWPCWRDGCRTEDGWRAAGMQDLIDAVRSTGARQPVIVSSNGWGNDLSGFLRYAPRDPSGQMVAGVHLYDFTGCSDQPCWDSDLRRLAGAMPVVTAELGQRGCAHDFVDRYMRWADGAGVSYLAWAWNAWDCAGGPGLIRRDGSPTAYGAGVKAHLAALAAGRTAAAAR